LDTIHICIHNYSSSRSGVLAVFYLIAKNRSWELYGRDPLEESLAQNLAATIFGPIDGYMGNLPGGEDIDAYAELNLAIEIGLEGEQEAVKKFRRRLSDNLRSRLRQLDRARATRVRAAEDR
jgi:hypothetical protein